MSPLRAFELMQPICAGIAAAHRQGIVHRDLKPLNVMIQDQVPTTEGVIYEVNGKPVTGTLDLEPTDHLTVTAVAADGYRTLALA